MSEMEAHKGKLVPILNLPGTSAEDDAKEICRRLRIEIKPYYDTWEECLEDEGYRKVVFYNGVWYSVQDTALEIGGFVEGTKNDDGSYDYYVNYYNGGASFTEVMEQAIKKANGEPSDWED